MAFVAGAQRSCMRQSWLLTVTALFAVVVCVTVVLGQTLPPSSAANGPIRLWRNGGTSSSYTFGRVQLVYNRRWGNICDDERFGITEASVICRQLGYTGASSQSRASIDTFGTDSNPTVLSSVDCSTSTYLVILQCRYDSTPPSSCTDEDDVSVQCYYTRIWDNPYAAQVRLTRGDTVNQGLVEVYCNGQWGTVCDDFFDQNDADTICRQLGYYGAHDFDHLSIRGSSSQQILLDDVPCSSAQPCIADCLTCPSSHNCGHSEDVTIECHSPFLYTGTTTSTCVNADGEMLISNGPVRLWRNGFTSSTHTSGQVQLVYNRQWGNICGGNIFETTEATVICHQLEYTGASSWALGSLFGNDNSPAVISNVDCSTSEYLVILQCSFNGSPPSSCTDSTDVSVQCYTTRIWDNPYAAQVRLTRGATVNQGLVEVYCNGQWGTVCDDSFDQDDADTICRQLGYYQAMRFNHLTIRGTFSQPIWLDDLPCTSGQSCVASCRRCPSSENCGHSEDVTIECYSPLMAATTMNTCVSANNEASSGSSVNIGAAVGGIVGGIVLLTIIIVIAYYLHKSGKCKQQSRSQVQSTQRINLSSIRTRTSFASTTTNTTTAQPSSQPVSTQPQQPPASYNLPRQEAPGSVFTYNQPSDPTITEAPPPAYNTHENYATYKEESNDLPPPYQPLSYNKPAAQYPPAYPP